MFSEKYFQKLVDTMNERTTNKVASIHLDLLKHKHFVSFEIKLSEVNEHFRKIFDRLCAITVPIAINNHEKIERKLVHDIFQFRGTVQKEGCWGFNGRIGERDIDIQFVKNWRIRDLNDLIINCAYAFAADLSAAGYQVIFSIDDKFIKGDAAIFLANLDTCSFWGGVCIDSEINQEYEQIKENIIPHG